MLNSRFYHSIFLVVIMILLSVTNIVENHDENTESLSYQKSHLSSSVMTESFVAELTVDSTGFPGYIGMTHDDRIIVYSEFQRSCWI